MIPAMGRHRVDTEVQGVTDASSPAEGQAVGAAVPAAQGLGGKEVRGRPAGAPNRNPSESRRPSAISA